MPTVKKCSSCLKRKALSQFATRSDNGKLRNQCKKCISGKVKVVKK
jgi:hypothetical protein